MNVNLTRTLHRIHLFFLMFPIVCSNTVCAQNGSYRGTSPLPPVGSLNSNSRILPKPDARRLDSPSMTNASGRDASTGMLPNVFYNSVSWEELRAHRRFTALPPAATVCIAGEPSYRFVRQDDDLWARLHPGRLTTGYAAAALGFFEPGAAAILKLSKGRESYEKLFGAYFHLLQPLHTPQCNPHISAESAVKHNRMLVAAFNEPPPPPAAPADVPIRNCEAQQRYSERDTCPSSVEEDSNTELNRLGGVGDTQEPGWQSQSSKNTRRRGGRARGEETGPKIGGASSVAAAAAAGDGISEEMKLRKARAAGSLGLTTLRCSWGTVQEAATLRVLCDIFPESEVCEVGLCAFDPGTLPSAWGIDPGSLPPLGASPDGLIRHPATGAVGGDLLEAMSQLHVVQANSGECGHGSAVGDIVEVVEVKNTCPFDYSPAARSRGKRRFAVSDRGPRDRIDPVWVPQLQLHMLCAGTQSALLVSRSVTLGLRIFRMPRDDRYLQTMLRLVSKLWQDHALRRRPPPRDVYGRLSEHKELLKRTKELAAAAVVVREVPPEEVALPGRDMRFFLD